MQTLLYIIIGLIIVLTIILFLMRSKKPVDHGLTQTNTPELPTTDNNTVSTPPAEATQDTLSIAQEYIDHKQYGQASELLIQALNSEPNHTGYMLKLLSVYALNNQHKDFDMLYQRIQAQADVDTLQQANEIKSSFSADPSIQVAAETLPTNNTLTEIPEPTSTPIATEQPQKTELNNEDELLFSLDDDLLFDETEQNLDTRSTEPSAEAPVVEDSIDSEEVIFSFDELETQLIEETQPEFINNSQNLEPSVEQSISTEDFSLPLDEESKLEEDFSLPLDEEPKLEEDFSLPLDEEPKLEEDFLNLDTPKVEEVETLTTDSTAVNVSDVPSEANNLNDDFDFDFEDSESESELTIAEFEADSEDDFNLTESHHDTVTLDEPSLESVTTSQPIQENIEQPLESIEEEAKLESLDSTKSAVEIDEDLNAFFSDFDEAPTDSVQTDVETITSTQPVDNSHIDTEQNVNEFEIDENELETIENNDDFGFDWDSSEVTDTEADITDTNPNIEQPVISELQEVDGEYNELEDLFATTTDSSPQEEPEETATLNIEAPESVELEDSLQLEFEEPQLDNLDSDSIEAPIEESLTTPIETIDSNDLNEEPQLDNIEESFENTEESVIAPVDVTDTNDFNTEDEISVFNPDTISQLDALDYDMFDLPETTSNIEDSATIPEVSSESPTIAEPVALETNVEVEAEPVPTPITTEAFEDSIFTENFNFINQLDQSQITLDLAKQYLDLGEYDSARRLINEVISSQASSEHTAQAQALLERIH